MQLLLKLLNFILSLFALFEFFADAEEKLNVLFVLSFKS